MSENLRGPIELSWQRTLAATAVASIGLTAWLGFEGKLPTTHFNIGEGTRTTELDHTLEYGYELNDPAAPLLGGVCVMNETVVTQVYDVPGTNYEFYWPVAVPLIPMGRRKKLGPVEREEPDPDPDDLDATRPDTLAIVEDESTQEQELEEATDDLLQTDAMETKSELVETAEAEPEAEADSEDNADEEPLFTQADLDRYWSGAAGKRRRRANIAARRQRNKMQRRSDKHYKKMNRIYGTTAKAPRLISRSLPISYHGLKPSIGDRLLDTADAIGDRALDVVDRISDIEKRTWALLSLPLIAAGSLFALKEYKESSFSPSSCAVDINKGKGDLLPGINLHWDCDLTVTRPDPIPSGGGSSLNGRSGSGENPCEDSPIIWTKTSTRVNTAGEQISTETKTTELTYWQAIRRWWARQNQMGVGR